MGGLITLAIILGVTALGGGSQDSATTLLPAGPIKLERFVVGSGAESAQVVRPEGISAPSPGIVFLHGWGEIGDGKYRAWINHLAEQGNVVIVPRYQTSTASPPESVLPAALAGVRAALEKAPIAPETLVVVGHSAGAALAADYAAFAASEPELPAARAVYAVYPGRAILGSQGIPAVAPGSIPRSTRITAIGGTGDTVVGTAPALELLNSATSVPSADKRYIEVTDPRVYDHYAPLRDDRRVKMTFWQPLDRLIDSVREKPSG